jgi:hypothetical protein
MLMMILAATTAIEAPPQKAEPTCPAARVLVAFESVPIVPAFGWSQAAKEQALLVSNILEPDEKVQQHDILPPIAPPSNGPSVLIPACKPEPQKKKDHPLA